MGTKKASVDGTDLEQVDEIRRQVAALTDASIHRHGLPRGTAEYGAALEREESLADRVWKLGAALPPLLEPSRPAAAEDVGDADEADSLDPTDVLGLRRPGATERGRGMSPGAS